MAELNRTEQLDAAIGALLAHPAASVHETAAAHADVAALVRLAADLRHLPGSDFRQRLASDLQRKATMASKPAAVSQPLPTPAITPYLCVRGAAAAIAFYTKAFGAIELGRLAQPDGKIVHAEIQVGAGVIMLADELPEYGFLSPQSLGGAPMKVHLYCDDADKLIHQAVAAGAKLARPVQDEFYGNREGQVADPFGYTWIVSTQKEALTFEEIGRRYQALLAQQPPVAPGKKPVKLREGFTTLTPYLAVREATELIDFVVQAFGAVELGRTGPGSEGGLHAEVRIGDSIVMIGGGGDWRGRKPFNTSLHLYVSDADAAYQRALAAGAVSLYAPADREYGDREAGVRDLSGNQWFIATHKATGQAPAGMRAVTPGVHAVNAPALLDFLKRAFAAEEVEVHKSPEGRIVHAKLRIGDALVEMGEAHGQWQPLPSMFYLYVDDCDAWYRRAVAAGAESIQPPTDQPYGDRVAAVKDAHGHTWYMGTPMQAVTPNTGQKAPVSPAKQTRATVIPTLRYKDAPAAIEWLCRVFGFEKHFVVPNPDGSIAHAQLSFGNGMIMLGSARADEYGRLLAQPADVGGRETQTPYVIVSDPDAIYSRAKAAGAEIVTEIQDADYGGRFFSCRDLEGHHWNFGSYDPWASQ